MSVLDAARDLADDYPGGASALAHRIGKNATTFLHELRQTGSAKLGLADSVRASTRSGDPRILNAFAAEMGFMTIPLPEALMVEGDITMMDLGRVAKEFGDVVQEVGASCSDGEVNANELARIERQWGELLAAGQQMIMHIRAKHEAAKPGHLRAVDGGRE